MNDLKQRIFELAKTPQLLNLATVTEEGKPWVRYVFGNADAELNFRFCTALCSDKIRHIRHNANVHLSLGARDLLTSKDWLQVVGFAEISTAQDERHAFWNDGFLAHFTGPDDPNYCVVIVKPALIELASMANKSAEVWLAGK